MLYICTDNKKLLSLTVKNKMNYKIKTWLCKNVFYISYSEDGSKIETLIETPLDKLGCDLMVNAIKDFIDDNLSDFNTVQMQLDGNGGTEGVIVDLYDDCDDGEPVDTKTFWFEDYIA